MAKWLNIETKEDNPDKVAYIEEHQIPSNQTLNMDEVNEIVDKINTLKTTSLEENEYAYLNEVVAEDKIGLILSVIAEPPVYVPPTSSITNVTALAEVGSTVSVNITQTFNKNDAGNKTSEIIKKNGETVSETNTYTESLVVPTGNTVYSGTVNYAEGATKNNNLGLPDPTGKITAGSVNSANRTISSVHPIFYGVLNPGQTIDDIDLSTFTKIVASSTGTFSIPWSGVVGKLLAVVYPASSTTKTKWYVTALNSGDIGKTGALFPTTQTKDFDSPTELWEDVSFKVCISTVTNANDIMEFRNA